MDRASAKKLLAVSRSILDLFSEAMGVVGAMADEEERRQLRGRLAQLMSSVTVDLHLPILREFPELDVRDEKPEPEPPLSPEQQERVERLSATEIAAIDEALLEDTCHQWRKVARIVGTALGKLGERIPGVPDLYYAERVRHLVAAGRLESQGNLELMRFSEVRLPGAQNEKA
jgi:hypothetical protein